LPAAEEAKQMRECISEFFWSRAFWFFFAEKKNTPFKGKTLVLPHIHASRDPAMAQGGNRPR
jgi:hypothetical protein